MDETADFLSREDEAVHALGLGDSGAAIFQPPSAPAAKEDWGAFDSEPAFQNSPAMSTSTPIPPVSFMSSMSTGGSSPTKQLTNTEDEPEVIKQWREQFNKTIAERDEKSKAKHAEILAAAKTSLERFYADYNATKTKGIGKNRETEKSSIANRDDTSGNVWERAVKQIETASSSSSSNPARLKGLGKTGTADEKPAKVKSLGKVKDTSRMKDVLKSLVKDEKAPGITA
ncbi:hypothetical protein SmJEL517_g04156 [Synchytrium microbalum]|uniref:Clathrin light chain n=1 Tax=Synchytrium microbalum TaxID=1806994 RepID=A0A507C5I1_9FUNG|nr:uncharacterized protein SmJEL517_g04156 [Synchytrium microbalum]TPX32803.1 hypothetical protein SmJEL517_g04156 [Synchytrium microbalum]